MRRDEPEASHENQCSAGDGNEETRLKNFEEYQQQANHEKGNCRSK